MLITQDRVRSQTLPLTHELVAMMLEVRRASISDVLRPLQEWGVIRSRRGQITVLDRGGLEDICCECYRTLDEEFERLLG